MNNETNFTAGNKCRSAIFEKQNSILAQSVGGSISNDVNISLAGNSDSSEFVGELSLGHLIDNALSADEIADIALRDPSSGVLINLDNGDASVSNLQIGNREIRDGEQSINAGEIRGGGSCIMLGSDGVVTIQSNGNDVIKVSGDEIVIGGDLKISIDAIKVFADCINNNFAPGEFMDIVKERIKMKSNSELIEKRLGAIDGN